MQPHILLRHLELAHARLHPHRGLQIIEALRIRIHLRGPREQQQHPHLWARQTHEGEDAALASCTTPLHGGAAHLIIRHCTHRRLHRQCALEPHAPPQRSERRRARVRVDARHELARVLAEHMRWEGRRSAQDRCCVKVVARRARGSHVCGARRERDGLLAQLLLLRLAEPHAQVGERTP
eukprot:3517821-Prymnesium_polylepis.1